MQAHGCGYYARRQILDAGPWPDAIVRNYVQAHQMGVSPFHELLVIVAPRELPNVRPRHKSAPSQPSSKSDDGYPSAVSSDTSRGGHRGSFHGVWSSFVGSTGTSLLTPHPNHTPTNSKVTNIQNLHLHVGDLPPLAPRADFVAFVGDPGPPGSLFGP